MRLHEVVARTARGMGADAVDDVQVLARRPDANVVVALTLLPSGERVVAKALSGSRGSDGVRAAAAMRAVLSAGASDGPLAVPQVRWHDPSCGLLVTTVAPGVALDAVLRRGELAALRRAGEALAALHALPAAVAPAVRLRDCLVDLVLPQPAVLSAGLRGLSRRVAAVLDGVLAGEPVAVAAGPLHRDVHLRQLHADCRRTWLLDWDLAAQGDPALDVGNLVGSLHSKAAGEAAVASFLTGYAAGDRTDALARVGAYEAFTYLRLACKRYRLEGEVAGAQAVRLLAAAERRLELGDASPTRLPRAVAHA